MKLRSATFAVCIFLYTSYEYLIFLSPFFFYLFGLVLTLYKKKKVCIKGNTKIY